MDKVRPSRPKLESFLKEVCAEDVEDTGKELFGPIIKKKISDTIKTFNEALKKIDPPQTPKHSCPQNHFLGRGSGARYSATSSSSFQHKPYTNQNQQKRVFRPNRKRPFQANKSQLSK